MPEGEVDRLLEIARLQHYARVSMRYIAAVMCDIGVIMLNIGVIVICMWVFFCPQERCHCAVCVVVDMIGI
jgi:hypothetical protein